MRTTFKKLFSAILVFAIAASFTIPTLAAEANTLTAHELTVVHGTDSFSTKEYTCATEFENIKASTDGCYALEVDTAEGTAEIPLGRLDVDLMVPAQYQSAMNRSDITDDIKTALKNKRIIALENECVSMPITIFSQTLLPANRNGKNNSTYFTYDGVPMRSDFVYSTGLNTGWRVVASGNNSDTVASTLTNIGLVAIGFINTPLAFLSGGISVLQAFTDAYGDEWISRNTQDFVQVRLIYNCIDQWTYAKVGNTDYLGLCTQKVTITKIGSEQYYYNTQYNQGKTFDTERIVNTVVKSEHFDSPWATAWQWVGNTATEYVAWTACGKTYYF